MRRIEPSSPSFIFKPSYSFRTSQNFRYFANLSFQTGTLVMRIWFKDTVRRLPALDGQQSDLIFQTGLKPADVEPLLFHLRS